MSKQSYFNKTPLARLRACYYPSATLAVVAEQLGVVPSTLSYYESGKSDAPAQIIKKMAFIYGVSMDKVLQAAIETREKFLEQKAEQEAAGDGKE